jgi:hypothetical protein
MVSPRANAGNKQGNAMTSIGSIGSMGSPNSSTNIHKKQGRKQKPKDIEQWQTGTTGGTFGIGGESLNNTRKQARPDSKDRTRAAKSNF